MGAEQVGYLCKGPVKIPAGKIKVAVRACRRQRKDLLAAADDPEPVIREFVDWWRTLSGCDTCSRTDPDNPRQVLVYAGDMTYGDEPDGCGYQMLKQALAWGFAEALGIR